jgi:hypothetical protein
VQNTKVENEEKDYNGEKGKPHPAGLAKKLPDEDRVEDAHSLALSVVSQLVLADIAVRDGPPEGPGIDARHMVRGI